MTAEASRLAPASPAWHQAAGRHRLFGGHSPIRDCEAHFHETFIIGYVRSGSARTKLDGVEVPLERGDALLVNPYQIVECDADAAFAYDVCYPDAAFMREAMQLATGQSYGPRFVRARVRGTVATALGLQLTACHAAVDEPSSLVAEQGLLHLLAKHADLLARDEGTLGRPDFVVEACNMIERGIENPISITAISAQLKRSRTHFARAFRAAVGLSPNIYARQLRLARALERVRSGESLADVSAHFGFFDQAHFTREFKRVYGTTPGRLVRDVARCRHCA